MKAFDSDVLTLIGVGNAACIQRASVLPESEQGIPIIVAEQLIRGRFNTIRQAEGGKSKISIEVAYSLFDGTLRDIQSLTILAYSPPGRTARPDLAQTENTCRHLGYADRRVVHHSFRDIDFA